MLNILYVEGDRQVQTTYLLWSILPGKLAEDLKFAHLFIPQLSPQMSLPPLPLASELWAWPALKCGSSLKLLFGVGGERGRRERRQFFPAAAANQSKLLTQTAHSTAGATLKPYLWVQSYCDTFHHGVWGEKLLQGNKGARWFLTLLFCSAFREGKTNPESGVPSTLWTPGLKEAVQSTWAWCFLAPKYG